MRAMASLQISSWHGHAEVIDDEEIEEAVASDDEIGTSHVPQTLLHAPQRGSQQLLRAAPHRSAPRPVGAPSLTVQRSPAAAARTVGLQQLPSSPDGSCYDDCCSDAWTVFCLPCRCATHLLCMPFVGRCVSEDAYSHVEKRVPKPVPPSVVLAQAAKRTKSAQAAAAAKAKALSAGRTRSKESPEWRRQPSAEEGGASAV